MYHQVNVCFTNVHCLYNATFPVAATATGNVSILKKVLFEVRKDCPEEHILRIASYCRFILSPEERPVILALDVVRLQQEQSWDEGACDEGEVGAVVTVVDFLRRDSHSGDEGQIRERMVAEDEVCAAIYVILCHDVREVFMDIICIDSL